ncbi:ABC-F family ATP-binding cassette domain-containing protein [Plantactinospora siamensis]|uniref:ABC-F family ATP-binding cassette domain-containing protein n=1 Tax=Plantactinospora siamensis TaxID=555372 RepID=A0ABV6NV35_9ACTN
MPNIVNLDRVSKGYGAAGPLLTDVSLGLDDADRVGVVGLNGAGKSTLLRLLTRTEEPDDGRVTHRRDLRVAWLPQQLVLDPEATVRQVVLGTAWLGQDMGAEHEWAGDAGVRAVLDGLGMPYLGLDQPVGPMSGGERRRVALAALLVRESDLLILDEPTNHLDVAGVDWLARHLVARRGALVVVTHDRWFLDAVCTTTWEVADRTVRAYEGGFAAWTLARAERARLAAATEARRQNLLRKEIAWLRRGPPARTSKPRFRIEAANALIADEPEPRDTVALHRLATARLGKQVYELADVTLTAGDRPILDHLSWQVGPGDRIAIVGANGAGKTTLLRLLAGVRGPDAGTIRTGSTVRPAFLSQELAELPGELRVLEAVEEVARRVVLGDREVAASQLAEMFGFDDRRLWTPVGDLSGGERRRLQMLRLLAAEPNVLLFDEPTNDLDTDTLASLEDLLDSWPGTVIVASHDRYLIERVTEVVYGMFGDGRLVHLPGGVDEYLARAADGGVPARRAGSTAAGAAAGGAGGAAGAGAAGAGAAGAGAAGAGAGTAGGGDAGGPAPLSAAEARTAKKELSRLERQIGKLEQRETALHEQLAEHATDYSRVAELDGQLRALRTEREQVEEAWLTLADRVGDG